MHETIRFFSSCVRAYTEDEVDIIGFGDDDEEPHNYIILSRYDEPGADDLSRDEMIGIQTSTSAHEVSSAISCIHLLKNSIDIHIKDENVKDVGAKMISTSFDINDVEFDHLRKYIRSLVCGSSIRLIEHT